MRLVLAVVFLWAGLLWGHPGGYVVGFMAAGLAGALAYSSRWWGLLGLAACALLLGSLLVQPLRWPAFRGGMARVVVETARSSCGATSCWSEGTLLECVEVEPGACPAAREQPVRVGVVSNEEPPWGAKLVVLGALSPRQRFLNPGPHPAWGTSVEAMIIARGAEPEVRAASWFGRAVTAVRASVRHALEGSLRAPHAGIARALLLGDASAVDRELDASIRQAGVSHVLAVSGMHVTVLAGALVLLLRWLWLATPLALAWPAERAAASLGVVLAPLVACLCGGAPSAFRAAFTSALMFLVRALGRTPCPVRVAALALAFHAALDPPAARHPGFVLSVLATVALLTAARGTPGIRGALRESFRAWLSTAPYLAWVFGSTSFVALLANVLLLPLGGALIPVAVVHLGASLAGIGGATAWALELVSGAFVGSSRLFAQADPGLLVPPLTVVQGSALALLALTWLVRSRLRTRLVASGLCLALGLASELWLRHRIPEDQLRITFLDVGQGDATLLELGTGERVLIDAGGAPQGGLDPGELAVVPLLRALRIDTLDVVVLSHPHPDHYGGLFAVLEAVKVKELWDTGQAEAEGGGRAAELLALARQRGVRIVRPAEACGAPRRLGAVTITTLWPCPAFDEALGANDNSFVLRIDHGQTRLLATGDIEHEAEARLISSRADVRADLLKVAHHGSRTSSGDALLAAVSPRFAVISAGRANRFGHPHAEVEERLRARVHEVLRVDQRGGMVFESDGRSLRLRECAVEPP